MLDGPDSSSQVVLVRVVLVRVVLVGLFWSGSFRFGRLRCRCAEAPPFWGGEGDVLQAGIESRPGRFVEHKVK